MILATVMYRSSHIVVGLFTVLQHQRDRPAAWLALGAALASSVMVYGTAVRRREFSVPLVWLDVVAVGCLTPFAAHAWGGSTLSTPGDWPVLLGTSSSAVAAVSLEGWWVVGAVGLLAVAHLTAYRYASAASVVIGGHLISLVSSAVLAWVFWWYLSRQGRLLDDANARALEAEARRARYAERLDHHRALHDTVLATLTAIAGGVDASTPQVRERCAREAAYLRRLIQRTSERDGRPLPLGAALEDAVRSAESLNLRVTAQYHAIPRLSPEVSAALADAVTEALNNVRRHAGTNRAYLTATGDGDGVLVTVVDRGAGFAPDRVDPGLGLRRSVHGRLAEVGGLATLESAPGEGVRVELRWPR
ncbi:ATP-binding protein [Streptantibioticus parmotrematis]|uniref:sensor histidine kinase n=1 Tax=Streptantibioticus parmotrematis TaxID=2873249 RepID=UPI0033D05924